MLLEYERAVGSAPEIAAARRRGEEYLLERSLFRRRSTGEVANAAFLELAFPPPTITTFSVRSTTSGTPAKSPTHASAMPCISSRAGGRRDGRWLLDCPYDEALALPFGESVGEPSRWNTLRTLRVLRWYERRRKECAARRA